MTSFVAVSGGGVGAKYGVMNGNDFSSLIFPADLPGSATSVAFSPDGSMLAVGHQGSPYIRVYRTRGWELISPGPATPPNVVQRISFSPDGSLIALGTPNGLRIHRTDTWERVTAAPNASTATTRLAWSPDGSKLIMAFGSSPFLRAYDTSTWSAVSGVPSTHALPQYLEVSPDGILSLGFTSSPFMRLIDISDWSDVTGISATASARGLVFSPDGNYLAVGVGTNALVYHMDSKALVRTFSNSTGSNPTEFAFSPDSTMLAYSIGISPYYRVGRISDGVLFPNAALTSAVQGLSWSPEIFEGDSYEPAWLSPMRRVFSLGWSGPDTVRGSVKLRLGGEMVPQRARVRLQRIKDQRVVARRWSAEDGTFEFHGIDARRRYITLAEYPTNPDNPNDENFLRPVAGVSLKRGES